MTEVLATFVPKRGAGVVAGGVRTALRVEGAAALIAAVVAYQQSGASWLIFVIFFLAPDLSFAAYLGGPRPGALIYNSVHTYTVAAALLGVGWFLEPRALPFALIWFAHIGMDRMLGYGLKYQTGFGDTHLGRLGKG